MSLTEPSAKIIADSTTADGYRLTTMEVVCHRFVLAEFNTHRAFSRNSASSRAIPIKKRLDDVTYDDAEPLEWPSEQPGMQGGSELQGDDLDDARLMWHECRATTLRILNDYLRDHPDSGHRLHKSLLNRLVEPWLWHTIVVSSTEWNNFFRQRCSPLAQPEIRATAEAMQKALEESTPQTMYHNYWHMPYTDNEDFRACQEADVDLRHVSVARCARVSYLTQDGKRDVREDEKLYQRLISADPPHWSPLEHVATPSYMGLSSSGNFDGWDQLRHHSNRPLS